MTQLKLHMRIVFFRTEAETRPDYVNVTFFATPPTKKQKQMKALFICFNYQHAVLYVINTYFF